jgi:hypothetical protein
VYLKGVFRKYCNSDILSLLISRPSRKIKEKDTQKSLKAILEQELDRLILDVKAVN